MGPRLQRQLTMVAAIITLALIALPGCTPPVSEGGFDAADPGSKLYAIRRADSPDDADKIPDLIAQLNSDDPAVRMYAIVALERVTGTRLDYDPYAPAHKRDAAVRQWADAYENGTIQAAPTEQADDITR